jgi:hypothetical protein
VPEVGLYNLAKQGVLALSEGLAAELASTQPPIGVTLDALAGTARLGMPPGVQDPLAPAEPSPA